MAYSIFREPVERPGRLGVLRGLRLQVRRIWDYVRGDTCFLSITDAQLLLVVQLRDGAWIPRFYLPGQNPSVEDFNGVSPTIVFPVQLARQEYWVKSPSLRVLQAAEKGNCELQEALEEVSFKLVVELRPQEPTVIYLRFVDKRDPSPRGTQPLKSLSVKQELEYNERKERRIRRSTAGLQAIEWILRLRVYTVDGHVGKALGMKSEVVH